MSPEQQRRVIAETCGLKWPQGPSSVDHIPDYLSDLNAMHEAEKVLDGSQLESFIGCLCDVLDRETKHGGDNEFRRVHATAAQRAEAFLRTIGKWDDSK